MNSSSSTVPSPDFSGLWIPLVSPFLDGAVDHAALARLTAHLARTGIRGVVVCGSTGEAAALSKEEQLACLRTVAAHAGGLPLVMGLSGHHLPDTRAWVQRLAAHDVPPLAGLLVPAPHYVRPAQDGLRAWFTALADTSAVPLVVYDIPTALALPWRARGCWRWPPTRTSAPSRTAAATPAKRWR